MNRGHPPRPSARGDLARRIVALAGAALVGATGAAPAEQPPLGGSLLSGPAAAPAAAPASSPLGGSLLSAPAAAPATAPASSPLGGSLLSAPAGSAPGSAPLGGSLLGGAAAPGNAAAPSSSLIFTPGAPPPAAAPPAAGPAGDLGHYQEMADKLYKATSSDAETFQQAIGNPQLRQRLQQTLKIPLTDDRLRTMAAHAQAEAAYWAAYRRGIAEQIASAKLAPTEEGKPNKQVAASLPFWDVGSFVPSGAEPAAGPPSSGGILSAIFPLGERTPFPTVSDQTRPLLGVGTLPLRPAPLLEIGNGFLATGPLSQGFDMPGGAVWQPRLWVFGTMRSALQDFYNGTTHYAEWANRLDLFANLQLTGTERLVVGMQPLNYDESGAFSGVRFAPGATRGIDDVNANIRTLFFEGDLGSTLPDLDKLGILPIDFGYTIGRQPLFYQNGTLINDSVTMVGLARNSIHLPYTSNVLLNAVYAWDHVQRTNRPLTLTGEQPSLWGVTASIDSLHTTYDLEMLHVDDARQFGDAWYIGGSAIQRFWLINTTFRVNSSIADGPATAVSTNGTLVSLETSFNPYRSEDIVYFNPYVAVGNFTQAAQDPIVPGPLGGLGITYAAFGIGTAVSALSSAADNVAGFATGYQAFWDAHRRSLTLEFGDRENIGANGTFDAQAVGARFQQALGQRVLFEVDATYTWRDNHTDAFGLRTEIDYQF
ncbi:MAG TPA: hypothetical protein VME41_05185 [Stellaceae bacterium]|nr:hypothetical protein [Stellaceae bacterium]